MTGGWPAGRPWGAAEEDALRAAWGVRDLRELAAELGRTPAALQAHAYKMGLPARRPQRPWTTREVEYLRSMPGLDSEQLAVALGRTGDSVRAKREALGIRTGWVRWEPWEVELARDATLSSLQVAAKTGRAAQAVLTKRSQLGVKVGKGLPRRGMK